jgi:hypothetical protein
MLNWRVLTYLQDIPWQHKADLTDLGWALLESSGVQ